MDKGGLSPKNRLLYEQFRQLDLAGCWIGLEQDEDPVEYFCTPVGAEIIGWDNGIHYCFIRGLGDTVFCVNPENYGEQLVYPLARDFREFLGLLLTAKNTNTLEQVILWDRSTYDGFVRDPEEVENASRPEVQAALEQIRRLGVEPAADPFGTVKRIQRDFPYGDIPYTNEYYDTLGLERPDGSEPEEGDWAEIREVPAEIYK